MTKSRSKQAMIQKYAFTTAAMAAALEETPVSYEDLAEIEREFDDAETEIIRQQVALTRPLYARRHTLVSQIPNFWPLVLEQAPPDIDQYIQPSDSALLLSSLTSLSVSHFQLHDPSGDPRSVSIKWEFAPNEYFEDRVLEKRFWYRRSKEGWSGLVSEPVRIHWRRGKDLTGGLGELVWRMWEAEQTQSQQQSLQAQTSSSIQSQDDHRKVEQEEKDKQPEASRRPTPPSASSSATNTSVASNGVAMTPEQKALKRKIEQTGMGGLSFFAWFGFIGRWVSAEESAAATAREVARRERLRRRKALAQRGKSEDEEEESEDEDEEEEEGEEGAIGGQGQRQGEKERDMSLEIFPDGDDLAVAITEDLWPGAIKYFVQAQEQDALSDADFESDDDDDEEEEEERGDEEMGVGSEGEEAAAEQPPSKKRRS